MTFLVRSTTSSHIYRAMSQSHKIDRLQQMKRIFREYDSEGNGLGRRFIAEKICLHYPDESELKSVENTVGYYLSRRKNVEFLNPRRGFWTLISPDGSGRASLAPLEEVEAAPTNQGSLLVQANSEAGPSGEAVPRIPDHSAHPGPNALPNSNWPTQHAYQTQVVNATSYHSIPSASPSLSNNPSPPHISLGRSNTNATSGTWADPRISHSLAAPTYYSHPPREAFSSNSAGPVDSAYQIATAPTFVPETANRSSYRLFESQAAFGHLSSSAPVGVSGHQFGSNLQFQPLYQPPPFEGHCPTCTCAQPL